MNDVLNSINSLLSFNNEWKLDWYEISNANNDALFGIPGIMTHIA